MSDASISIWSVSLTICRYISYRQSYAHHPAKDSRYGRATNRFGGVASEDSRGLLSAGAYHDDGDAVIEMDLLPPRWADIQEEVGEVLADITIKSGKLDKIHQKHVLPGFDDDDVKNREEREIEQLTQEITKGFYECQKAIKRLEKMVKELRTANTLSKGDETMARNIQVALAARVQEVSATFRKKQSNYLNKLRALEGFESPFQRSATPVSNPYSDPSLMESDADKAFSQNTLQQQAQKRFNTNDTAIVQREREINEIAKGIIELADIFKELQNMVIDQGTMLDRIDYNVERTVVNVKGAEKELTVATNYQKRSIKRKILLLLLLLIIGMFILLLVKPKRQASPDKRNNKKPP